jgi:hypothetical protein
MVRDYFDTFLRRSSRLFSFMDYLVRRAGASEGIYPSDEPSGVIDGPDPDRVVVIGEATALGYGVLTHRMGVAAQFASLLSVHTGRGAEWMTVGLPGSRIRSAVRVVEAEDSRWAHTDFVIVIAGIADTFQLTSVRTWSRHVRVTIDALVAVLPVDAQILLAEIPPLSGDGGMTALARVAAARQARRLNQATRVVVAACTRCRVVAFPTGLEQELWHPQTRPAKYADLYRRWAKAILEEAARGSREGSGHAAHG